MLASHVGFSKNAPGAPPSSAPALTVDVTTDQTNFNLFTAAGSPGTAKTVTVNISSGVKIRSNAAGTPAFDEGTGWAPGTTVILNNLGAIQGMGGAGGAGGSAGYQLGTGFPGTMTNTAGTAGGAGGTALKLTVPTSIANAAGEIFGGGGGGGGGNGSSCWFNADSQYLVASPANGGGGGQSANTTSGGAVGTTNNYTDFPVVGQIAGTSGSSSGAGTGGAAYDGGASFGTVRLTVGKAGDGGAWGIAGSAGQATTYLPLITPPDEGWNQQSAAAVGAGGAAGKAIDLNGQAITWLSGNDSTHVKGAVA